MLGVALILSALAPPVPTPIGIGPRFHLDAVSPAVRRSAPVGRLACRRDAGRRTVAHVELFALRRVLILPAGIGTSPKRCSYPVRTREPTGVVEFVSGADLTLGHLFAVWGQPLSRDRMAGFRGEVRVYVAGRRRRGDPRSVPLRPHGQIVVEVGGYVPPHPFFLFPEPTTRA
jgi:hypothetical protein